MHKKHRMEAYNIKIFFLLITIIRLKIRSVIIKMIVNPNIPVCDKMEIHPPPDSMRPTFYYNLFRMWQIRLLGWENHLFL